MLIQLVLSLGSEKTWTTFRMLDLQLVCSYVSLKRIGSDWYFCAVWISPINQNYEGSRTTYGDPYHGYWIQDHRKLNDKFGTADDLTALVTELHKRDM